MEECNTHESYLHVLYDREPYSKSVFEHEFYFDNNHRHERDYNKKEQYRSYLNELDTKDNHEIYMNPMKEYGMDLKEIDTKEFDKVDKFFLDQNYTMSDFEYHTYPREFYRLDMDDDDAFSHYEMNSDESKEREIHHYNTMEQADVKNNIFLKYLKKKSISLL